MKKIVAMAACVAAVLSMSACGSSQSDAKTEMEADCLDVPQGVMDVVASGSDTAGFKGVKAKAVKGDTDGVYWLAMTFTADSFNGDEETGIWLVSGLDAASAGPVMSVDAFAKQFTHWPKQVNGKEYNGTEAKAKAAQSCLA